MLGILLASLVDFLEAKGGSALRDRVCAQVGMALGEKIRLDMEYEDSFWQRLYAAALSHAAGTGASAKPLAEVEREYAFFAGEWLVNRFPGLIHGATSAREILRRQPLIHNTLGRAHRSRATLQRVDGKFRIQERGEDLLVTYSSPNNHPGLYRALVDWVAFKFQERIDVTQKEERGTGQSVHIFHLRFLGKLVTTTPRAE